MRFFATVFLHYRSQQVVSHLCSLSSTLFRLQRPSSRSFCGIPSKLEPIAVSAKPHPLPYIVGEQAHTDSSPSLITPRKRNWRRPNFSLIQTFETLLPRLALYRFFAPVRFASSLQRAPVETSFPSHQHVLFCLTIEVSKQRRQPVTGVESRAQRKPFTSFFHCGK